MDKLLLAAFLSSLAGFLTAVLSIVKLVNEKESKTTEYRQAWTESVRKSLAELVGQINAQAGHISTSAGLHQTILSSLKENKKIDAQGEDERHMRVKSILDGAYKETQQDVREARKEIYQAYALARLHFKPNDLSFNRIEQKFDTIMQLMEELSKEADSKERGILKEKIHSAAAEVTNYSRDILKTEWEAVKKGEPAYQKTKTWSIAGCILMLFLLFSIGIHAGLTIWKPIETFELPASSSRKPLLGD